MIKVKKLTEKQVIIFLVVVAYLTRIILSPFYVMFPHIPHDFYAYIGGGKCMVEGRFLMMDCPIWSSPGYKNFPYGPFSASLMAVWYLMFGEYNFLMFKLPAIVFDSLNTLMIYFIGKKLFNKKIALCLSLIYIFSFIALYNSAALGNDDIIAMFFVLTSIYFLIEKKLPISVIFYAIALMLKNMAFITLPALFYYIFKEHGFRHSLSYILSLGIIYLAFLSPFIWLVGIKDATYYIMGYETGAGAWCMSFYNIFRFVTNVEITSFVIPTLILSYLITLSFIFMKKLKNNKIELFRNISLLWIVTLLFGGWLCGSYLYLIFPFLLILLGSKFTEIKMMTRQKLFGVFLIFLSLLIYSIIYREGIVLYSKFDRILLLSTVIIAPIGVFNLLQGIKKNYRIIWTAIILAVIMYEEVLAAPLLALPLKSIAEKLVNLEHFTTINRLYGDHIKGNPEIFLSYGIFYGGPALILWSCLGLLYYLLLKDKFKK